MGLRCLSEAELGLVWPASPAYRAAENVLARELAECWSYLLVGSWARSQDMRAAAEDRLEPFERASEAARRAGRSPWGEIARYEWARARELPAGAPDWLERPASEANAMVRSGRWTPEEAAGAVPGPTREHRALVAELQRRGFAKRWSW
jgi:hypothetical protein